MGLKGSAVFKDTVATGEVCLKHAFMFPAVDPAEKG